MVKEQEDAVKDIRVEEEKTKAKKQEQANRVKEE